MLRGWLSMSPTRSVLRDALVFLVPSIVAAMLSVFAIGMLDGLNNTTTVLEVLMTAGYLSYLAVPIALAISVTFRLLWRSWVPWIADALVEPTGGAPRLLAWLIYMVGASWALSGFTFNVLRALLRRTSARHVVNLSATMLMLMFAVALLVLSRPSVNLLTRGLSSLDRKLSARRGRSPITPRNVMIAISGVIAVLVYLVWRVSIKPRLGYIDFTPHLYIIGLGGLLVAAHLLWPVVQPRKWAVALALSVAVGATALGVGAASYGRHERPSALLDVWANTALGGPSVNTLYDIQSLRGSLHVDGIAPTARPGAAHPDVILITVDTVRADFTPPHSGKIQMPRLAEFGKHSAVFMWAFSPGNTTYRSLPTIASGVSTRRIRGRALDSAMRLDPRHVMLAERFRAAGYDTAGFFCCDTQFDPTRHLGLSRGIDHVEINQDDDALSHMTRDWIEARRARAPGKPLFVWVHFAAPARWQQQYPRDQHGPSVRKRYSASLEALDTPLDTLLSTLWTDERQHDTIIAVTSDHGEGLGEHNAPTHATNLYSSQTHVPLLFAGPGIKARKLHQPVGLVDIAPTLLDIAGFVPPGMPQMDGVSLAPLLRGQQNPAVVDGEALSVMIRDRSARKSMRALVSGRFKLIEHDGKNKADELYDLVADPRELNNLAKKRFDVLRRLKRRLRARDAIDDISPF